MIRGTHLIVYSTDAEADRASFRDVLGLDNIDIGGSWLIFKAPPTEIAFHPDSANGKHELYFMCDDVKKTIAELSAKQVKCSAVHEERWGSLTMVSLPGGGELGIYQPKHAVIAK